MNNPNEDQTWNPCTLNGDELIPAKIWELLRRNPRFQRSVGWLLTLDGRARKSERHRDSREWNASWSLVRGIQARNPFAGTALQWLVPDPLFREIKRKFPDGLPASNKSVVHLENESIREGTTPNPKDRQHWHLLSRGDRRPRTSGGLITRGPEINRYLSDDQRLCAVANPFDEWQNYHEWDFTIDTPWPQTPQGFRNSFSHLWRQSDASAVGGRKDAPHLHETDFFQEWSLPDLVNRASTAVNQANEWLRQEMSKAPPRDASQMQRSSKLYVIPQARFPLSDAENARLITFAKLSQSYRVFAVPKNLFTQQGAEKIGKEFTRMLKRELPDHFAILGTDRDWDDFLAVQRYMNSSGLTLKAAQLKRIKDKYKRNDQDLTAARQTYETDVVRRVRFLLGKLQLIFPSPTLDNLLARMVRRRKHTQGT